MYISLGWFIAVPVLCLVFGMFVGAFIKTSLAWNDGWHAGYEAAHSQLENLPSPRFVGEE